MNLALKLYRIHERYTKNANMIHTYQLFSFEEEMCFDTMIKFLI